MNQYRTFGLVLLALHFLAASPTDALAVLFQLGPFTATDGTVISGTLDMAGGPSYESLFWTITNPDGSVFMQDEIDNIGNKYGSVGGNLQLVGSNGTYQLVGTSLSAGIELPTFGIVAPDRDWFHLYPNPNSPGMEINAAINQYPQAPGLGREGTWDFPALQAPFVVATGSQPLPEPSSIVLATTAIVLVLVSRMNKSRLRLKLNT